MSKALILTLIFTTTVQSAFAQRLLFMGGGGEPQNKETTIFDSEVESVGNFISQNRDWKADVYFNGGHNETEKILHNQLKQNSLTVGHFTQESYNEALSQYEEKIKNGEIRSGEKLLVYITTHGAKKSPREKTHQIATSGAHAADLNTLSGGKNVDLDRIQSLIDLAKSKGVKLALLDFSCHSGSTLALHDPNVCIITASGPDHFGYTSWGKRFSQEMEKGKNLEEIFLKTFSNRGETAFPMISSPVGMDLQEELYKLMSPYLYYWDATPTKDKFKAYIETQVLENKCEQNDLAHQEILRLSQDMESILKGRNRRVNFDAFRRALNEYHSFQKSIKDDLIRMDLPKLNTEKEKFCTKFEYLRINNKPYYHTSCNEWTLKEIMLMDVEAEIVSVEKKKQKLTEKDQAFSNAYLENLKKLKTRKQELLFKNPEYAKYKDYYKSLPDLNKKTWGLALNVSKELQKVYTEAYTQRSKNDHRPNACKDFVL